MTRGSRRRRDGHQTDESATLAAMGRTVCVTGRSSATGVRAFPLTGESSVRLGMRRRLVGFK